MHSHQVALIATYTNAACPVSRLSLPQREQKELAASKAVVKGDKKQEKDQKPKILSQDGDTIYIGFEKE